MGKALHSMIRVLDLERSIEFYQKAFGLGPSDRFDFDDFTLVYLRNEESDFELELTWNHGQEEAYSHGSGYGHLAICVDDLEATRSRLREAGIGVRDIVEMKHQGNSLARFFFTEDPDGYQIEVIEDQERNMDLSLLDQAVARRSVFDLRALDLDTLALAELEVTRVPEGASVIDLRSKQEYASWHYPKALRLDFPHALQAFESFDRSKTYVLYCDLSLMSSHLAEPMRKDGFDAFHFKGGTSALRRLP